jgi:serine/threonine protein phosphatase PrpC
MIRIEVQSAGVTDAGLVRVDNQDQFFVADLTRGLLVQSGSLDAEKNSRLFGDPLGHLFFIADGMGGHRAGSEASMLAIKYFVNSILNSFRWMLQVPPASEATFVEDLKEILLDAHKAIQNQSASDPQYEGMGTTFTMVYVVWPKMFVVHAGDTRCYMMRAGELRLITSDHTVANQMMRAGRLDPQSIERSPWSNILVNALGAGANEVFAEIHTLDLLLGDTLLLCSDGLNKHVTDLQIRQKLLDVIDPEEACDQLIQNAKNGGGSDNITVVVARFTEPRLESGRMKIMASHPTDEYVLQDIEIPETDLDTCVEANGSIASRSSGDTKETIDFGEQMDDSTGEFFEPK